ncbi:hypothetical protein [uncultured Algibacter sp.]|uniref:hypothetical protein n=1 Tax=uncultured Algibacter sp. TaxID=298659 RepID=UPI00261066AA|nr:hypothetical protein [uncultured Algibacter sp.]
MKKYIFNTSLFALQILFLMFVTDYFISYNLKKNHQSPGEIEVWNDIYDENIDVDIAIYGSSRAWVHIDPSVLEDSLHLKAYNFGIDGHNFWLQYLRHKEYIKHNNLPKTILLSLDVFSLQKRENLYGLDQFLPYMLWNKNIIKYTSSYNGFTFKDYYLPLLRYHGEIRKIQKTISLEQNEDIDITYRQNGFRGMEKEWNNDLSKAKLKMSQYKIDLDSTSINLFNQFLTECKENNIEVILVYTPEFIDGQKFVENRDEIIEIYKDFTIKHKLLFLDYSNHELSYKKEYFYNSLHLNKKGADIFTKELSFEIKTKEHINGYKKIIN